jgi:hypothetical protein
MDSFGVALQAKKAHEFMWYHIKDPDQFKLKPPRRWDPSGLKKHVPHPFYNREDGHLFAQQHVHNRQSVLIAGTSRL